jgi:hypothetical protein
VSKRAMNYILNQLDEATTGEQQKDESPQEGELL